MEENASKLHFMPSNFFIHPQILIFSVSNIASFFPYWLRIKFVVTLFFCLFAFIINLWHRRRHCGVCQQSTCYSATRTRFLPERDYVTFGSLLSQFRLSSVTLVHPTQGVEPFGKISSPLCTLATLWPPCKILRKSSQGNPSVGSVKRKRGIKIERFRWFGVVRGHPRSLKIAPFDRAHIRLPIRLW